MLIENVSTYISFNSSDRPEWEFINEIIKRSGAKILLDINNIYVSAINHGFNPKDYLEAIPVELVGQIHLAGFSELDGILFDTHSKPVYPEVWELFIFYIQK